MSDEAPSYPALLSRDSAGAASQLAAAFATASPRVAPRSTPPLAYVLYTCVFAFWIVLTTAAFVSDGLFAWSIGVAYIAYDTLLIAFVATRIAHLARGEPPSDAPALSRPSVAIVIAAWNEAKGLPATIDALMAQDDPADLIVIADDGSDDATADVLHEIYGLAATSDALRGPANANATLYWLGLKHEGKAAALNVALAHIATDIVVTVDADTLLAPDALRVMRAAFAADPHLVVASGVLTPVCDASLIGRGLSFFQGYEYIRNFMSRYAWSRIDALLLVSGAFAAFRRDALMAVGGFDRASLVEDYELIHRLQRFSHDAGFRWRVKVLGRMRATTAAPDRVATFLRQRRRWFAGFLQTQYWNRDMTGSRGYGAVGRFMLPVKALDTLQPLYGLTALALLPVFLLTGRAGLVLPAFGIMSGKIVIDLVFFVACIALYRRWTGDRVAHGGVWPIIAAIAEPFTFQPLRHIGAAWGWGSLLMGDLRWGRRGR